MIAGEHLWVRLPLAQLTAGALTFDAAHRARGRTGVYARGGRCWGGVRGGGVGEFTEGESKEEELMERRT